MEMNVRNDLENLSQVLPSQTPAVQPAARSGNSQPTAGGHTDTAELSAAGTQAAQSSEVPEVRLDKVASIQAALKAGTYQVPAADVAQKVISSMLIPGN